MKYAVMGSAIVIAVLIGCVAVYVAAESLARPSEGVSTYRLVLLCSYPLCSIYMWGDGSSHSDRLLCTGREGNSGMQRVQVSRWEIFL